MGDTMHRRRMMRSHGRTSLLEPSFVKGWPISLVPALLLTACSSDSEPLAEAWRCDETLKTAFKPNADTTVTFVKAFSKGETLALADTPAMPPPAVAENDVCMVKLNVGPGNPGPAGAPSTSAGIGIEVWLPTSANWNGRVHVLGGGGWSGGTAISSLTAVGAPEAAGVAAAEGAVSAQTDTGHTVTNGSFAIKPDGSINTALWRDFSERAIHEMAVVAKALATGFYQEAPEYSYWEGCSTGGRQGLKEAQVHPEDFDGIVSLAPAINWTKFITAELYPQIVIQRDLGGVPLTTEQVQLVSSAVVSACDGSVTGEHDGYISDHAACRYDAVGDLTILCAADGGSNTTTNCLSRAQATAVNKIWYGQTRDGSVASPASDNGFAARAASSQLWFGVTRGSAIGADLMTGGSFGLASSRGGVPSPFPIATDQVALNLQNPAIATPMFANGDNVGADGWKSLTYADLARAWEQGVALQSEFANINTDNPDLSGFRARGGKLLMAHGMADQLIPPQGTLNYYTEVTSRMGGLAETQEFFRYFEIPGMAHCRGNGSAPGVEGVSPAPDPPMPAPRQLYQELTEWVENDQAPETIVVSSAGDTSSRPLCLYPTKLTRTGDDLKSAASYACR
jgi:hypothetical protein